jgi:hypothetical protein
MPVRTVVDLTFDPPFGVSTDLFLVLEIGAIVVAAGLWFLLLAAVLSWTRPADVDPEPANADFPDDLPPAVVSFLANRWRLNEDAAEATLLDLAARRWIELRQPGNDPTHTTVHLLPPPTGRLSQPTVTDLTPYDEQVLQHVRDQAVDDVVPVTALTFRDAAEATRWTQRLHGSVLDDARARGLTRRRFSPGLVTLLSVAALLPAGLFAILVASIDTDRGASFSDDLGAGAGGGLIAFALLSALAGRPLGERDTPLGRAVAARWLGLRAFLRNDEAFAELPPAAVAVWDRYLSYGDALGVTRVCSALLDLGMGDRKRVWSSFGGGWHRIRVRYPRFWGRYGATAPRVTLGAVGTLVVGGLILKAFTGDLLDGGSDLIGKIPLALGLYLVARGLYRLGRLAADLAAPQTLTGEVLWVELWKQTQAKENKPSVPIVHYFALDDGTGDRMTAWALPSDWSERAQPGDVVTVVVRPWTRRVTALTVDQARAARLAGMAGLEQVSGSSEDAAREVGEGSGSAPVGASASGSAGAVGSAGTFGVPLGARFGQALPPVLATAVVAATVANGGPGPAGGSVAPLLTADEVSAAVGRRVVTDATAGRFTLGPFEMIAFSDPDPDPDPDPGRSKPVLMLAVARGRAVSLVMRTARHGTRLGGAGAGAGADGVGGVGGAGRFGDEAWQGPGWVVGRRGETMLRITLETGSRVPPQALPALLATALSHLP